MDNMLIVALMVVSCILINPFVSASETKKVAAVEQTQPDNEEDFDEEDEEDEDSCN